MEFRVVAAQHPVALLARVLLLPVAHLPQLRLADLPQVAEAGGAAVAVDVAALLPQSLCIARSNSFRCGSEFYPSPDGRGWDIKR
jgi:hypothetical protein